MTNANANNYTVLGKARERRWKLGGGLVGLTAFLALGLWPALVMGAFLGLGLAAKLTGTPLEPTLVTRGIVVLGAALFVIVGGILCTALGAGIGDVAGHWVVARRRNAVAAPARVVPTAKAALQRTFAFGGGIVGLVLFLAVGLLPALVYGGFAGVSLASGLLGHPVNGSILARVIVVFGMVIGSLATGALFVVVGAALGAALSPIAALFRRPLHESGTQEIADTVLPSDDTRH